MSFTIFATALLHAIICPFLSLINDLSVRLVVYPSVEQLNESTNKPQEQDVCHIKDAYEYESIDAR